MAITAEFAGNNDPRLERCVPVLDLYMHYFSEAYRLDPSLVIPYIQQIPLYSWLDESDAHILLEERADFDLDVMVIVCHASLPEDRRVMYLLSNDNLVPTLWESLKASDDW